MVSTAYKVLENLKQYSATKYKSVKMEDCDEPLGGVEEVPENLRERLENKVVVDLDQVSWDEAGRDMKWSVLLKAIAKDRLVSIIGNIWKLKTPLILPYNEEEYPPD